MEPLRSGDTISVTVNGSKICLDGDKQHIFVDIFNHIEFDPLERKGTIVLKLNGAAAGYTDILEDGDSIEIYREQQKS